MIRAAITLKLCQYEGTGAIVAALTTSIPESPTAARNWDYRYCWLRDAAFVVRDAEPAGRHQEHGGVPRLHLHPRFRPAEMQPVYGIHFESALDRERRRRTCGLPRPWGRCATATSRGCRSSTMSTAAWSWPPRTCSSTKRLTTPGDGGAFDQLERAGDLAYAVYDQPDAGLWEFRGRQGVHTYSQRDVLGGR